MISSIRLNTELFSVRWLTNHVVVEGIEQVQVDVHRGAARDLDVLGQETPKRETPKWETGHTITPSPHHPLGAKGVGEWATVGAPPAIVNAVVDALSHLGVRHIDIPVTPEKV